MTNATKLRLRFSAIGKIVRDSFEGVLPAGQNPKRDRRLARGCLVSTQAIGSIVELETAGDGNLLRGQRSDS